MPQMTPATLQNAALDYAVAKAKGLINPSTGTFWDSKNRYTWKPTTIWEQGGTIIEQERISTRFDPRDARGPWYAVLGEHRFLSPDFEGSGPTPLIAAMRCYVASVLGPEFFIPTNI